MINFYPFPPQTSPWQTLRWSQCSCWALLLPTPRSKIQPQDPPRARSSGCYTNATGSPSSATIKPTLPITKRYCAAPLTIIGLSFWEMSSFKNQRRGGNPKLQAAADQMSDQWHHLCAVGDPLSARDQPGQKQPEEEISLTAPFSPLQRQAAPHSVAFSEGFWDLLEPWF